MLFKQSIFSSLMVEVAKLLCSSAALQKAVQVWTHTHNPAQGTSPGLLGSLGWALLAPRASEGGALRNAMKVEGLWSLIQVFWLHAFMGCSHSSDLETYSSTDSMVSFKGSFATVKIDYFPQKAAAGLYLFPNSSTCPVLCLLLLCLICLTVLHTWLTSPFFPT